MTAPIAPDPVYALAASPDFARDGVCFAARASGLYRSDDGGRSWRATYGSLPLDAPPATFAVALAPDFATDGLIVAGVHGGILRSSDGGHAWTGVPFPLPPPVVSALVVSPAFAADSTMLAGTLEDGVFRSEDCGLTWSAWNFGLFDPVILCLDLSPSFAEDGTIFAGTASGLFRSTNGGRSWLDMPFPADAAPVLGVALSPAYARDGVVFAGTEGTGLWRSDDRGAGWTRLGGEALGACVGAIITAEGRTGDGALLVLSDGEPRLSRDGGQAWLPWPVPLPPEMDGTSLLAVFVPAGLGADATLLLGGAMGDVIRLHPEG